MSLQNLVWNLTDSNCPEQLDNEFEVWKPGDPMLATGERLLIGIASWSIYDRQLLALLESVPQTPCKIDLFGADNCKSQEAIRTYIPKMGFAHHTPFVGHWRDGALIESENGYAGRHLIYRVLGLNPAEADAVVLPTSN